MIKIILVLILSLNLTNVFAQQLPDNAVTLAAATKAAGPGQTAHSTGLTKVFADQSQAANLFVAKEIQKNRSKMLGKRRK